MVKIDIHKEEYFYQDMTLSDPYVIKLLIKYRYKYDPHYLSEQERNYNLAGDAKPLNQEAIALYAALDELIKQCKFKKRQLRLIKYIEMGYEFEDIKKIDDSYTNIGRMFNNIINKIIKMNEYNWRVYIHKKIGLKFRQCTRCKKDLPANSDFFGTDPRMKDGFKNYCKRCDK